MTIILYNVRHDFYFVHPSNQTPKIDTNPFYKCLFAFYRIWRRSAKSVTDADNNSERWPVAHCIGNHRRCKTENGE